MVADDSQRRGDGGARHNGKERNGKDRRGELSSIVSCVHKCGVQALPSVLKNARKGTKILEYPPRGGAGFPCTASQVTALRWRIHAQQGRISAQHGRAGFPRAAEAALPERQVRTANRLRLIERPAAATPDGPPPFQHIPQAGCQGRHQAHRQGCACSWRILSSQSPKSSSAFCSLR